MRRLRCFVLRGDASIGLKSTRPKLQDKLTEGNKNRQKISFFGHFGTLNFGNESTFQAVLYHLRQLSPVADVLCICTGPEALSETRGVEAVPISGKILDRWKPRTRLTRWLRQVCIGLPSELWRWRDAVRTLRASDMLIIPGTGLLTDACGLRGWGPYNLFKWCLVARMCRCRVLFVSVGAGPVYSTLGRYFVKTALALADFRSYRDYSSMKYVKEIGLRAANDRVYPDLAFSLPETVIPHDGANGGSRPVVGLGLMEYAERYSVANPSSGTYVTYLENLVVFVEWLLAREYDIRLLIGEDCDRHVTQEFRCSLKERLLVYDAGRIIDEPVDSVEQLLSQLAGTDLVVATRFHNVLLALLSNKPVISISFHHKCASLMSEMGLSEYCLDINHLKAERLIERFCDLEKNAEKLRPIIREKTIKCRAALDEQYRLIFKGMDLSGSEAR